MAPTDALFWYAESALPIFRPIIGGLYILDRPPDRRAIKAGCDAAMALIGRLRQRVVETPFDLGLPEWVEDPHFDEADPEAIPDPHRIVELFTDAIDELDQTSSGVHSQPSGAIWRSSSTAMSTSPT
jgi:hypothetical protein